MVPRQSGPGGGPPESASLLEFLAPFDAGDLVAAIGALQLVPGNSGSHFTLQTLASIASLQPVDRGRPPISASRLRKLFLSEPVASLRQGDDPPPSPLVETVAFFGGGYNVIPGPIEHHGFTVQRFLEAIFLERPQIADRSFLREASTLLHSALILQDEICRRARLARYQVAEFGAGVVVPAQSRLSELKDAISFENSAVEALLAGHGVPLSGLTSLCKPDAVPVSTDPARARAHLERFPILRTADRWIVAAPCLLLPAAMNRIVLLAMERDLGPTVATRFRDAVWAEVRADLRVLGNSAIRLPGDPPPLPLFGKAGFHFLDLDKVLVTVLIADDLSGLDAETMWSGREAGPSPDALEAFLVETTRWLAALEYPPNDVLYVILLQPLVGSTYVVLPSDVGAHWAHNLPLAPADLETIALSESTDPLLLYVFARSRARLRAATRVFSWGTLDEFAMFKDHHHSYYLNDDRRLDGLVVEPGYSASLRTKTLQELDRHTARAEKPETYVSVVRAHKSTAPLYLNPGSREPRILLALDGAAVWVVPAHDADLTDAEVFDLYHHLVDAVSYWLWQMTPVLAPLLAAARGHVWSWVVEVRAGEVKSWKRAVSNPNERPSAFDWRLHPDPPHLEFTMGPSAAGLFNTKDNGAERAMVRALLAGLAELVATITGTSALPQDSIDSALETYAPLGPKKKMLVVPGDQPIDLSLDDLPPARLLSEGEYEVILDDVGRFAVEQLQLAEGQIPSESRCRTLNGCVGHMFELLRQEIASARGAPLLRHLVAMNETLTSRGLWAGIQNPARLACFADDDALRETLVDESSRLAQTSLASRFAIEVTVAEPPCGIRPFSLSLYDRILALVDEISSFGYQSDLIRYEMFDIDLSVLPSGRLGFGRRDLAERQNAYGASYHQSTVASEVSSFSKFWDGHRPASSDDAFEAAFEAEFGISFNNFLTISQVAIEVAHAAGSSPLSFQPYGTAVDHISGEGGLPREDVERFLGTFSLGPRAGFLMPPPNAQRADLYPWRFNRSCSYLRKPFLIVPQKDATWLMWGPRHLSVFRRNLVDLCLSGRLKAVSMKMRNYIGQRHNIKGREFNDRVAEELASQPDLVVRTRVRKIGHHRLDSDIDVLVGHRRTGRMMLLECKAVAHARTPFELRAQFDRLIGVENGRKGAAAGQLAVNLEWVEAHQEEVQKFLCVPRRRGASVRAAAVMDHEVFLGFMLRSPVELIPIGQLRAFAARSL